MLFATEFSFEVSAGSLQQGVTFALFIGIVGGFFPAWRVARLPVVTAFSANGLVGPIQLISSRTTIVGLVQRFSARSKADTREK